MALALGLLDARHLLAGVVPFAFGDGQLKFVEQGDQIVHRLAVGFEEVVTLFCGNFGGFAGREFFGGNGGGAEFGDEREVFGLARVGRRFEGGFEVAVGNLHFVHLLVERRAGAERSSGEDGEKREDGWEAEHGFHGYAPSIRRGTANLKMNCGMAAPTPAVGKRRGLGLNARVGQHDIAGISYFTGVGADEEAAWDDLVRESPQGNVFLTGRVLRHLADREHPRARVLRVACAEAPGAPFAAGWAVLGRRRAWFRYCSSFPLFYAGPMLGREWSAPDMATKRTALLAALGRRLLRDLDFLDTEAAPQLPDTRGLFYAGIQAEQIYTHVWPPGPADEILRRMNRSKRREAKISAAGCEFGWEPMGNEMLRRFNAMHNLTLEKFKWKAPGRWQRQLADNMRWLEKENICRLWAARPKGSDAICAAVSVLLSPDHSTAWLWRVAYESRDPGLIPALYWQAAREIRREMGDGWTINFGGSPRLLLSLFKDHLGAEAVPHWRLGWQRPGWKPFLWNIAAATKEHLRRSLHRASSAAPASG